MRTLRALMVCMACVAGSAHAQLLAPPPARPDVVMNTLTSGVIAVLKQDLAAGRRTDIASLIETIVPVFDFQRMTRIAVARNWRLASPQQQAELVAQFRTLLVRTYSYALSGYQDQEITYRPLRAAEGDTEVLVRSIVRRQGAPSVSIDYEMAEGIAGWQVYDVKVEGVSLVLNYRESFAGVVSAGGIDALIKALSDKNRQVGKGPDAAALAPVLMIYSVGTRGPK
jgi:phospholipid transport system substrate-binding protein